MGNISVRLVALTQPTIPDCTTAEELLAFCARVSNPENQHNNLTAPRLLKYLVVNGHWSPFEMVSLTLEITTTRDIARQILRHRSFSFQEFSQRYASPQFAKPREARMQDHNNRQNSLLCTNETLQAWWVAAQEDLIGECNRIYDLALDNGIAKEVARAVLPEGLTESKLYMAGTLRSWLHYVIPRTQPSTQKEHRDIALRCRDVLLEEFPALNLLLMENTDELSGP